jgi:hypothetical protein
VNHLQHNGAGEPDFYSRSRVPSCPVSPAVNISGAGLPPSSVSYPHTIGQSGSCNHDGGAPQNPVLERNDSSLEPRRLSFEEAIRRTMALPLDSEARTVEQTNCLWACLWCVE